MTTLQELRSYVDKKKEDYPHLSAEFEDLYALAYAEVEDGESLQNEINLCIGSIDELTEETT